MSFEIDIPGRMQASLSGLGVPWISQLTPYSSPPPNNVADRPVYESPYDTVSQLYPEAFPKVGSGVLAPVSSPSDNPILALLRTPVKSYPQGAMYTLPYMTGGTTAQIDAAVRAGAAANQPWYSRIKWWPAVPIVGGVALAALFLLLPKRGGGKTRSRTRRGGATVRRTRRPKFVRKTASRRRVRR